MHLAQLNIGTLQYDQDDPRVADFMNNLDRVNAIAESMPGFVWRLKDDTNNATGIDASSAFPSGTIVNMGVWEDAESLSRFVWQTVHKRFYQRKAEWFKTMADAQFVMWPVPVGYKPTLHEAAQKLAHMREHGSSDEAFGWDHLAETQIWQAQRCA